MTETFSEQCKRAWKNLDTMVLEKKTEQAPKREWNTANEKAKAIDQERSKTAA